MGSLDILTVGLVLFIMGILAVFGFIMAGTLASQFIGLGLPGIPAGFANTVKGYFTIMDGFSALGVALLLITMVIINFLTRSNPVFLVLSILMDVFIIPVGWLFSVMFDAFATNAAISPYMGSFPITVFVFQNFAVICFIIVLTSSVSLYIGSRQGNGIEGGSPL